MKNPKNNDSQKEDSPSGKKLVMLQPILRAQPDESPQEFADRAMAGLRKALNMEKSPSDQSESGELHPDAQKDADVDAED
jgi:hypothetical protein